MGAPSRESNHRRSNQRLDSPLPLHSRNAVEKIKLRMKKLPLLAFNRCALSVAMSITVLALSGCVGMSAPYEAKKTAPVEVNLIPVTADLLAQQALDATMKVLDTQSPEVLSVKDYRYVIRPADVLLISVPTIVSFNSANAPSVLGAQGEGYVVYNDGTIYLPYSGSVQVGGLTLKEAQERIVQALSGFLRSPQVIVALQDFRSQRVMVTGQVQKPGYLPITDVPLTLIGALSTVGGIAELRGMADPRPLGGTASQNQILSEYPDLSHVVLKRGGQSYTIDINKVLSSGDIGRDLLLIDGDVVVVPSQQRSNIFVLGEVLRPGLVEVNRYNTDLAGALQACGGINQLTANASRVYVIRGDSKKPTVFHLDAGRPDSMLLAQKFQLQPSDVIFVSETRTTRWNRGLLQILPTVQGVLSTAVFANTIDNLNGK